MRTVWLCAAALALLAVTSALRTTQAEGASRYNRRLPAPTASDVGSSTESEPSDAAPTFKPRSSRRQEISSQAVRSRSQSRRPQQRIEASTEADPIQPRDDRNERYDSRRISSRSRSRNIENTTTEAPTKREPINRSRSRQNVRRIPTSSTQSPLESFSPVMQDSKVDTTNIGEITKVTKENNGANQFRRRSSSVPTIETITPKKRGRINTRPNARSLDLDVSGTTNALTNYEKEPTTARTSDLRNSRKLRYKQRLSETDTNLTGEGITATNEVIKSSQKIEYTPSQNENQTPIPIVVEETQPTLSSSTESLLISTTSKASKFVKRPLTRGKGSHKPSASVPIIRSTEEISEDDNYPESFKALIQAKNASTQASSPTSESLTLKASQKIYKTVVTSSQSNTGNTTNKYSRLRSKLSAQPETNKKKENEQDEKYLSSTAEPVIAKKAEFRTRGSFNPRSRKLTSFAPTTPSTASSNQSSSKPVYKYSRKFKVTTTESPKKESISRSSIESSSSLKKSFVRPTAFARKSYRKSISTTETSKESSKDTQATNLKPKMVPRTSYYSRIRKNRNNASSTTEPPKEITNEIRSVEPKTDNTSDMPLILTLLNNPANIDATTDNQAKKYDSKESKEMFIIAVTSKESQEKNIVSESLSVTEENEREPVISDTPTTIKYHAIYKDPDSVNHLENVEPTVGSTIPTVRNLQTGKSRKRVKSYEKDIDISNTVTPRTRERNIKKYSDSYPKPTEASTNGISPEPDKVKGRFSSKFRASYLDKPFYKPTVPSITSSSTAWLKFFVTDDALTKSIEEPYWFDMEDFPDVTTESMTRQSFTSPSITHESSIELVEGEEIDLGPDVNAISFTKTRSKLTSADLRLSESLIKPSQIMNVEATHHSPSVTVSIFDALAEILTSTPRTRLSSTTEVLQNQNKNVDIVKSVNGVSNNINVNNVQGLTSQDTTSADLNTNAKLVQNTDQTPNVINSLSVGERTTQPLNTEDGNITPVNTAPPIPLSTPVPTTPLSARRPFAIKVLYSEPSDQSTTAPEPTTVKASTDNPTTVHNTVSELLISSNSIVSSELTSMLSNNIKNIIEKMDGDSKTRLSQDMAKLLKTLIPRALDRLATQVDNVDIIPNTTPYSLEDIKDTENVEVSNNIDINTSSTNIVQNVMSDNNVNTGKNTTGTTVSLTDNPTPAVNSPVSSQQPTSTASVSSDQTTVTNNAMTTVNIATTTASTTTNQVTTTSSNPLDTDSISVDSSTTVNSPIPLPFLSNFRLLDDETTKAPVKQSSTLPSFLRNTNQNVSPLQLWVLSKKARVLKMIEDLIRFHNNEIATATPVTDVEQTNNIPLSNRLTKIMNSFTSTTEPNDPTTSSTIPSAVNPTMIPTTPIVASSNGNSQVDQDTMSTTTLSALTTSVQSVLSRTGADTTTVSDTSNKIESTTVTSTTELTTNDVLDRSLDESKPTTLQENTETTTDSMATETTTQINTDTTTIDIETMTISNIENNNTSATNETNQNLVNNPARVSGTEIPKKDYVIFGILPNNTVVRKNPNDDVLESLTEASPYIIYGVLPNNTVIRKFPNGTRVPRVMQKIDILPISPWSLRNPYSPIHNNPAIVRPQSNPIRVSTNTVTSTDTSNNGMDRLTTDTVNNLQQMISSSALNIKDSSSLGITTTTNKSPAEKSTASHVLSLRTTTMLPSVDEILLNSISTAAKEEMVISSMTSSTREPRILTLDIDPETKQIRTEKSGQIKFVPIDEVTVAPGNSNVLKLATKTATTEMQTNTPSTVTEINTQTPQIQTRVKVQDPTTTVSGTTGTPVITAPTETIPPTTTVTTTTFAPMFTTTQAPITTDAPVTTVAPTTTTLASTTTTVAPTTTTSMPPSTLTTGAPINMPETVTSTLPPTTIPFSTVTAEDEKRYQEDTKLLQQLLLGTRDPKNLNLQSNANLFTDLTTTALPSTTFISLSSRQIEEAKLLQALLSAGQNVNPLAVSNINGNVKPTASITTTSRSIDADLKQLEEDTKLLKALLQATGQNPANFNLPTFDFKTTTRAAPITTTTTTTTTTPRPTTTTPVPTTRPTTTVRTTTSIDADIKKLEEDTRLLQALLQAVGQNPVKNLSPPIITGVTSNVRIASNPLTTSLGSNPTTPINVRPVYTSQSTTTQAPLTFISRTVPNTLQTTTEAVRISTTLTPRRTTTPRSVPTTLSARRSPGSRVTSTTEIPSTSTFSVEEDLVFLKNLKSVLKANPNNDDPEAALANRIIALAVERSLNEIQTGTSPDTRTGKKIANNVNNAIPTTTARTTTTRMTTTTTTTTTTTPRPTTTVRANTPSLEEDIKQFQKDTELLQALIKATGQDPSKFNIPTLPPLNNLKVSSNVKPEVNSDLKVLSNLLASPSPLTEPFDSVTQKTTGRTKTKNDSTDLPFGAKIAVKDDLKTVQDDAKLLKTLVKLQDAQETTTQRNKLAFTGQTSDEALKKLLEQQKKPGMVSEATQAPMSLSTEYGKSNDALLAALLKEQGFGPTTASSLDEQLRLSALLNQVVVTPKARRTTTPPPPPPPPRRPILDGLAWLWQQWRDTAPGPTAARPNRRPSPSASPSVASSAATSNRVNWFGSGPFVGNADDNPTSNRIPLEPPAAVTSQQAPGRGQLVSAAINVTRAFSQFLGAAIQQLAQAPVLGGKRTRMNNRPKLIGDIDDENGAAQTVQSVIRAGQRAATDVYVSGSGGSG